ncbi:hypothetical protein Poly51_35990 [Rubripirellula tenax]|uniref:Uncharacterized protein n=1 Tax=Rubripirellula tenax TaxID=2528015 RepID=A0A5C6F377_9BACT|nr:BatA domain-containing protein [Rubripirellula tenax]TWU54877.1 hypothetical protein Poly51_35990 [Rubripirellula tenax]
MSFLAPLFMLALPLLAIPIAVHLWRKRRRDTIGWGAMQFLFQDDHRQQRFSNIDKWLVLLARCLLLLLLIFALARPLLHSEKYGTLETRTDDVLVLDQSLSTSCLDGKGEPYIDSLREQAKQWVESRPRGASIRILTTAGRPQWLGESEVGKSTRNDELGKSTLVKALESVRPVAARSDLAAAMRFAMSTEFESDDPSSRPKRRVWLLTDGRATDWRLESAESVAGFCQTLQQHANTEIHLGLSSAMTETVVNVSLDPLSSLDWRKAPGERLQVSTRVVNRSTRSSPMTSAVWSLGGKEVSRVDVKSLGPGESETLSCSMVVQDPGSQVVACQISARDSLMADNRSDAVVQVLDRIPVLIVSDREPNRTRLGAADFLSAALGERDKPGSTRISTRRDKESPDETEREYDSLFKVERSTNSQLGDKSLDAFDAVVWMDATSPTKATIQRLTDYVRAGGGLWLVLGDETDVETYNRDWYAGGLGLSSVMLNSLEVVQVAREDEGVAANAGIQSDVMESSSSRIHPPTRDHPMVQWLSESSLTDLDQVLIERFYSVTRPGSESSAQTILRTGGGDPLTLLSGYGKGRVVLQTVAIHPSWTNWPLTGSFVVMADSWLRHLSAPRHSVVNVDVGTPLEMRLPVDVVRDSEKRTVTTEVITPGGEKLDESVITDHWRYPSTFEAGIYTVQIPIKGSKPDDRQRQHFAVTRPPEESELALLSANVSKQLDNLPNASVYDVSKNLRGWIKGTGVGETDREHMPKQNDIPKLPIWTPLLYGLLGFLVLELLLASYASIRRFGRAALKPAGEMPATGTDLSSRSLDAPIQPPVFKSPVLNPKSRAKS